MKGVKKEDVAKIFTQAVNQDPRLKEIISKANGIK